MRPSPPALRGRDPSFAATRVTPRRTGTPRTELFLYLFAAVAYIAMGFFAKEVFAWWSYGAIWLVALVWLGPQLFRRVHERRGQSDTQDADPSDANRRGRSDGGE